MDPIEAALQEAIRRAVSIGWKMRRRVARDMRSRECCALGAYLVSVGDGWVWPSIFAAGEALGLGADDASALAKGFDNGAKYSSTPRETKMSLIGARLWEFSKEVDPSLRRR